jgi:hypothetical protein
MKNLLLPIVFLLFLSVPAFAGIVPEPTYVYSNYTLYQENANLTAENHSTNVGHLYMNYSKPMDALNGMWEMKAESQNGLIFNNYTVPSACFNQDELMFRFDSSTSTIDYQSPSFITGSCFNGTDWEQIFHEENGRHWQVQGTGGNSGLAFDGDWDTYTVCEWETADNSCKWTTWHGYSAGIYEESMIWNIEQVTVIPPNMSPSVISFLESVKPLLYLLIGTGLVLFVYRNVRNGDFNRNKLIGTVLAVVVTLGLLMALAGL